MQTSTTTSQNPIKYHKPKKPFLSRVKEKFYSLLRFPAMIWMIILIKLCLFSLSLKQNIDRLMPGVLSYVNFASHIAQSIEDASINHAWMCLDAFVGFIQMLVAKNEDMLPLSARKHISVGNTPDDQNMQQQLLFSEFFSNKLSRCKISSLSIQELDVIRYSKHAIRGIQRLYHFYFQLDRKQWEKTLEQSTHIITTNYHNIPVFKPDIILENVNAVTVFAALNSLLAPGELHEAIAVARLAKANLKLLDMQDKEMLLRVELAEMNHSIARKPSKTKAIELTKRTEQLAALKADIAEMEKTIAELKFNTLAAKTTLSLLSFFHTLNHLATSFSDSEESDIARLFNKSPIKAEMETNIEAMREYILSQTPGYTNTLVINSIRTILTNNIMQHLSRSPHIFIALNIKDSRDPKWLLLKTHIEAFLENITNELAYQMQQHAQRRPAPPNGLRYTETPESATFSELYRRNTASQNAFRNYYRDERALLQTLRKKASINSANAPSRDQQSLCKDSDCEI